MAEKDQATKMTEEMKNKMAELVQAFDCLRNNEKGVPLAKFAGHYLLAFLSMYWPQLRNFPIRKDDVIVASFPKSGTWWVHYIAYLLETENFVDGVPPIEHRHIFELPRPPLPSTVDEYAALPGQHFIATHLPAPLLPKDAFNGRVIYIYRNPKDAVVSYYFHHLAMDNPVYPFDETFEQFVRRYMSGMVMAGPYPDHVKGYYNLKAQGKPVLIVRYEDLIKDLEGSVRRIAEFLGKKPDDSTVKKIAELSSFGSMKSNEELNWSEAKKAGFWNPNMDFHRKGAVGDWRNHFTDPQLLADFDKFIKDTMPAELMPPCD